MANFLYKNSNVGTVSGPGKKARSGPVPNTTESIFFVGIYNSIDLIIWISNIIYIEYDLTNCRSSKLKKRKPPTSKNSFFFVPVVGCRSPRREEKITPNTTWNRKLIRARTLPVVLLTANFTYYLNFYPSKSAWNGLTNVHYYNKRESRYIFEILPSFIHSFVISLHFLSLLYGFHSIPTIHIVLPYIDICIRMF